MNKVFVGRLSWNVDNNQLAEFFESVGEVKEAKVIYDRETEKSRGFGFVTFAERSSVQKAIQELDGKYLDGRAIRVNEAEDRRRG